MKKQENENKNKGGRPKKSPVSLKNKIVGVCFSEPEFYVVKHRAEKAGLPLSIYCHDAVLKGQVVEPLKKEELDILKGFSGIGNNLNQLTRTAHMQGLISLENEIRGVLSELIKMINSITDDWENSKRKKL